MEPLHPHEEMLKQEVYEALTTLVTTGELDPFDVPCVLSQFGQLPSDRRTPTVLQAVARENSTAACFAQG